jgi:hypothetical protein
MSEETAANGRATTFATALEDLKQRGSMLLVVGTGGNLGAVCDKLRGDDGDRRRLYLRTAGRSARPEADVGVPSRTVQYGTDTRSASATAETGSGAPDRVVASGLPDLHAAVDEAVGALEPDAGYGPGQLRVCVDGLETLFSRHDDARVFQFCHALRGRMRETRGMCHVHLPVAFDDDHVQVLSPLFDAVVEVRYGSEQRWHLTDPDLTTDWLPL